MRVANGRSELRRSRLNLIDTGAHKGNGMLWTIPQISHGASLPNDTSLARCKTSVSINRTIACRGLSSEPGALSRARPQTSTSRMGHRVNQVLPVNTEGMTYTKSDAILGGAIEEAAAEAASLKLIDRFPLVVWQTGSGTQTNMNTNEVVSNRANEILGSKLGSKSPVHPNDHVNMSGSSNCGTATAMHIAVILDVEYVLIPALKSLQDAMMRKSQQFNHIVKLGRTHLQDAVPLSLGQEFSGFATQLTYGLQRVEQALEGLRSLAMGGTATGTGLNTYEGFHKRLRSG